MTHVDHDLSPSQADLASLRSIFAADPAWVDLAPASAVMALPDKVVLHAGPPLTEPPCAPVRNSAAMAVVFEGWADSEEGAKQMIDRGAVALLPAQDFHAVVPLAAVLTRNMLVHVVVDRGRPANRAYAPINGGSGPAMRLGKAGSEVVSHLRWINGPLGATFVRALREVSLVAIANEALARGDDLHGRTAAATDRLARELFGPRFAESSGELETFVARSPSMFLNLWMAACKCMAQAALGIVASSAVVAIGGNGREFGLKVASFGDRWFSVPAEPPTGKLEAGHSQDDRLGAIGDSAIVDAQGFGAMAMHCAPAQQHTLGAYMPTPSVELGRAVMSAADPRFLDGATIRGGLFARRVADNSTAPAIALGILDRHGQHGRIGGGVYAAPLEPFATAHHAIGGLS